MENDVEKLKYHNQERVHLIDKIETLDSVPLLKATLPAPGSASEVELLNVIES